jgi:hypothetical protein
MNTQKIPSVWLTSKLVWSVGALLIAAGIFIWLPHRTRVIEAHSMLQTGKSMDAEMTLQSSWGWTLPDRVVGLRVELDKKQLPMPREAYYGIGPVDINRTPIIGEHLGFPEITLYGRPKSDFDLVKWLFLNNSYSERHLMKGHQTSITYHSEPPPSPQTFTMKVGTPDKNGIVAINLDGGKSGVINSKKITK